MVLQHTPCSYHPNKAAISICERCRRPICLEDKRIYRRSHSRGTSSYRSRYYTSHEYCVLCNSAQLSTDAKWSPITLICFIPFILIFFAMVPFFAFDNGFFGVFPIIFIIFIGFFILIIFGTMTQVKNRARDAEQEALRFRDTLNNPSAPMTYRSYNNNSFETPREQTNYSFNDPTYSKSFSLVCFECGSSLNIEDKFCSNCGDSTKEELEQHYSRSR